MKYTLLQKKILIKRKKIATAQYILPFAATFLIFVLLCIPCFYFTDYTNEITSNTSVIQRMASIWESSRKTVFASKTEATEQYIVFCQISMVAIAVSMLCYLVAFVTSLVYMVAGLRQVLSDTPSNKAKRIFLTFVPNRFVLFLINLLALVPAFFPRLIVILIERLLVVYSKVTFLASDIMIYAAVLWIAPILYFIATAKHNIPEFNVFHNPQKANIEESQKEEEEFDTDDPTSPTATLYRMTAQSKDEQAQKLRKLLGFDEKDDAEEKE